MGGPNLWADHPVAEVWLDLSSLDSEELPALVSQVRLGLRAFFRGGALPRTGALKSRPQHCLWLARALEWTLLELAARLGPRPTFSLTRRKADEDLYQVALDLPEESVAEDLAQAALQILHALRMNAGCDLDQVLDGLWVAAQATRPSRTTAALLAAARARGIPGRRIARGVLQLGQGNRQRRLVDTRSDRSGPAADWAAGDRGLLKALLDCVGVPCAAEPALAAQYRALIVDGRLEATLHWQPPGRANGEEATVEDVTDLVHPEVEAHCREAARVLALEVAEVRLTADDITQPLETQGGKVTEVIPAPQLDLYLEAVPARPVAERVLEGLFPPGQTGRIPVIAVTGTNGKTTVTRLLGHALGLGGQFVGMTCTDGIFLSGRCIDTDDCSGPQSARLVLGNPQVEVAVLETARGGILREGLGFDTCDLAVVTNIGEGDHLGLSGIETAQQLAEVKQTLVRAVAPWGTAVLNAADPLVAPMAKLCKGAVLFFARDGGHPLLRRHRRGGGRVAFVRDQALVLSQGGAELQPIPLSRIPLTRGGRVGFQVENVLACAGALWALNLPYETLAVALETFGGNLDQSPGRFNVLEMDGTTVVFDYGHNPSALLATIEALGRFPQRRRVAVYSAAGDRRDADMIRQGEILGQAFDQVILYEDHYTRGRLPGEIMSMIRRGLAAGQRVQDVQSIHGWQHAVEAALWLAQPDGLLLVQADRIDETVAYVRERLAAARAQGDRPIGRPAGSGTLGADLIPLLARA